MIEKITLDNFKNHAHTEIELGRVTALVGPNGAGKSTVLQAIHSFNRIVEQVVNSPQWTWKPISNLVRKQQNNWGISVSGIKEYSKAEWQIKVEQELLSIGPKDEWKLNGGVVEDGHPNTASARATIAEMFGHVIYFKAISQSIASPSYTLDIPPKLSTDGNGAASVISYLKTSQEETHKQIEDDLKRIVPMVKRIRVHPVPKLIKEKRTLSANGNTIAYDEDRQVIAQELIFDTESGDGLPASLMSEGTLITLALLTLLHTSDASLFLLDDIEAGLHPLAQRKLMQALKDFASQHNRQIILTTHSPYIVDELEAKDVWVMATDSEGISHCQQLSKGPNAEFALKVLTTGEFLGAEGEDWVLDQPAQQTQQEPAHA